MDAIMAPVATASASVQATGLAVGTRSPVFSGQPVARIQPRLVAAPRSRSSNHRSRSCRASLGEGATATQDVEVPRVRLGQSDVEVPVIGIGAWAWGDKFFWNDGEWSDQNFRNAKSAYDAAMDSGLTLIDTAEVYGTKQFGADDSESILGRFIRERKASHPTAPAPIVATKFAPLPWRLGREAVVAAVRDSMKRLQLTSIDLYQLHWPGLWGNEGFIDGLADCVDKGLVKAVGVSNYKVDRLNAAHKQLTKRGIPLASNQVHYNILYRQPELNGVKKACEDLGVTLIAYSPLAQGVLTGKFSAEKPPTGPRGASYSREFLTQAQPLLKRMTELGEQHGGRSRAQVALNWLLVQGNTVPIPGAKNEKQASEFAGALGWSLSADEAEELRQLAAKVPQIQGFPAENF
eukprot:TRINITY_DN51637_c0_g2_i1.p1 TRINITY_DN51637_c0_g2~~TRINITY_DN51637_c0_g2_i1.p1  ORF type:complete len:428 (+),score=-16.62 TRINITY_DN51637_c0_g2_i1:67-1284(+)